MSSDDDRRNTTTIKWEMCVDNRDSDVVKRVLWSDCAVKPAIIANWRPAKWG